MSKFMAFFAVLRHGSSIADPAIWKSRQNLFNALIGLLGAVAIFVPMEISSEDIASIAGGIAAVAGLLNAYLTTATTDKIGVQGVGSAEDQHGRPEPGEDPFRGIDGGA